MAERGSSPSSSHFEPLVDRTALAAYLHAHLPGGLTGDLQVERHVAGHSNETFFLSNGGNRWVLRRAPRGAFLPTAHDVIREYRVLSAVRDLAVRAPRPILLCEDAAVIGAPFYLMQRVDGLVVRDRVPPHWTEADRRRAGEELVDALVELHAVDWAAVGLEGFGRPDGYLARQVRRWAGQLALTEPLTRHVEDLHRAGAWLQRHVPDEGAATIVHGDYKLDNVAFAAAGPARLEAIFDWEMSTLGDPLADLAWMLSFWREEGEDSAIGLEEGIPTRLPGFATRDDLIARYRGLSGRPVGDLTFYLALAVWKLAILLEGSYARHLAGVTDDPFFAQLDHGVPALASRAVGLIGEPGR
jgi:aminoglycoside phosphotransferase (APT) family kinase protein